MIETSKELHEHYGSRNHLFQSRAGNKMEFWAKKTRQMYLLEGCFQAQKHTIPVLRLRNPDDSLSQLRLKNEIACVVEGREEFPDLNFVAEKINVHNIDK